MAIIDAMPPAESPAPLSQRLAWMGAIWLASVLALAALALAIRLWLTG